MEAEGWYVDPFGVHGARWFSDGTPTALVRDGSTECRDAPPAIEFDGPLQAIAVDQNTDGSDLLRSDAEDAQEAPGDGAFQAFTQSGGSFT
jgi:hypothetical protein